MKRRILCFGDSLTWGFNPVDCSRFDDDVRWTGVLQNLLGDEYKVIEEGQNGRTISSDDPVEGEKNGMTYLIPCLDSQVPLDAMVIMLGTNDLKVRFGFLAEDIAGEMDKFLHKVKLFNDAVLGGSMKVILMSPPHIPDDMRLSPYGDSFGYGEGKTKSEQLAELYEELTRKYQITFLDAAKYVKVSNTDSLHIEEDQEAILAKAVYDCYINL